MLVLAGLASLVGGARLVWLGGPPFYGLAGAGLLLAAALLVRRSPGALPVLAAVAIGSLLWSAWGAGLG